uniref:Uncharacterized protein n=1 Tax=Arundo donax TaxID=35708 RepID=A0A0A9B572_ARUDO
MQQQGAQQLGRTAGGGGSTKWLIRQCTTNGFTGGTEQWPIAKEEDHYNRYCGCHLSRIWNMRNPSHFLPVV